MAHALSHRCWTSPNPFLRTSFDVTQRVQDWVSGAVANYGFALDANLAALNNQNWTVGYFSRESGTASLRPQLIVSYVSNSGIER